MKKCRGCLIKCADFFEYIAGRITRTIIDECPCNICLVKMVCIRGCEEYQIFSDNNIVTVKAIDLYL